MPFAQGVMPAGQTPFTINAADDMTVYAPVRLDPVPWLSHNGWSCARWSALSRAQQLQMLRATFVSNDYSWTARGNDAYNRQFAAKVRGMFYTLQSSVPGMYLPFTVGGGTPPTIDGQLSQLLQAFNNACLGTAVSATNRPIPTSPVHSARPAGQSYTASAPGVTWFTGLGSRFLSSSSIDCAKWLSIPRVSQLAYLRSIFSGYATSIPYNIQPFYQTVVGVMAPLSYRYGVAFEAALSQLAQMITDDCLRSQLQPAVVAYPVAIPTAVYPYGPFGGFGYGGFPFGGFGGFRGGFGGGRSGGGGGGGGKGGGK